MKPFPGTITVKKKGPDGTGRGRDIQKAIDKALKKKKYCTVYIPCGKWILEEPLRLHPLPGITPEDLFDYVQNPNRKQQCIDDAKSKTNNGLLVGLNYSVQLTGTRPALGGQGAEDSFTVLECTFSDAPAIEIQAVRSAAVSNLVIEGQNRGIENWMNNNAFSLLHRDDVWVDEGVTEDHVAIAIDRHPGTGSSGVIIDNVNARYFAGGVSIGTSGNKCTQNSENHLIRRFIGSYLGKAGILLGQHQSKAISIVDSSFFGQQYWIDCVSKGEGLGYPPTIIGCNVGGTQRLFNLHHAYGHFACHGLFVESTLSLGTLGWGKSSANIQAVFTGCAFNLYQQQSDNANTPRIESIDTHLNCHRPVLFQGCSFQFTLAENLVSGLRIDNFQQVVFDTCTFLWIAWNGQAPLAFNQPVLASIRDCSFRKNVLDQQGAVVAYLHGKPGYDILELGTVQVEKNDDGTVQFTGAGAPPDIIKGDFISFKQANGWQPKYHVPDLANPYSTNLPFATVDDIQVLADNTYKISLHQVAETLYAQFPTTLVLKRCRTKVSEGITPLQ